MDLNLALNHKPITKQQCTFPCYIEYAIITAKVDNLSAL